VSRSARSDQSNINIQEFGTEGWGNEKNKPEGN
jgi:hypothetical protein